MASHTVPQESWYRHFIRGKTRIALAWVFAAVLVFSARQYPTLPGILICFWGAWIRFRASGFLRKDTKIAVGGPYAHSRNPLYLGTWLMALGTAVSIHNWVLAAVVSVVFWGIYHYIILDEETKLRKIFGAPYERYCALVPRFFPRILPTSGLSQAVNSEPEANKFVWEIARKNKAFEPFYSFAGLIGLVTAVAWAWQNLL